MAARRAGAQPEDVVVPSPSFFLGDRVRCRTNGERGYVTGFRRGGRLGFRYVVIWDDDRGFSLVPPGDLALVYPARSAPDRRRSAG